MAQSNKAKSEAAKKTAKHFEQRAKGGGKKDEIMQKLGSIQQSLLQMRAMYDEKVLEVGVLKQQIQGLHQLVTALLLASNDAIVVSQLDIEKIQSGLVVGYEAEPDEDGESTSFTVVYAGEDDGIEE